MTVTREQNIQALLFLLQGIAEIEGVLSAQDNDDGVTSVYVTDEMNKMWVEVDGMPEKLTTAWNISTQGWDGATVYMRRNKKGALRVVEIEPEEGTYFFQQAAGTANTPPLIPQLLSGPLESRNFIPGRVTLSENGGMQVVVEGFSHPNGWFIRRYSSDLTSYIPATSNMKAWTVLYYDPANDALGIEMGSEVALIYPLSETDAAAVSIAPNYIPLAAIELKNGMTAIDKNTRIIDMRQWLRAPMPDTQFLPRHLTSRLTIPAGREAFAHRIFIEDGGRLEINGFLRFI